MKVVRVKNGEVKASGYTKMEHLIFGDMRKAMWDANKQIA